MGEIERCTAGSEARFIVVWLRPPKGLHRVTVELVTLEALWPPKSKPESPRGLELTPALLAADGAGSAWLLGAQAAYRALFPALAKKYPLVERK